MMDTQQLDLDRLDAALEGRALGPASTGWDAARAAWNLAVDQRPAAVAEAHTVDDVQHVVRFAADNGLRVAPQGTGHGASAIPGLADAVLLRTGGLDDVVVDAAARVARVGAGATWGAVADAAGPAALVGLAGTSATVGVGGYTLGGGAGWLVRSHGLGAWSLRAADVVTAAGDVLRVDDDHDADLLWALRGSGGGPAVVVGLELDLVPLAEVYAGGLWWPIDETARIFAVWADWVQTLPDDVTSIARVLRLPPLPELPEHLRGRAFVVVEAALQGDPDAGAARMAPLRGLRPELDTMETIAGSALSKVHGDPPGPVPGVGIGVLLERLPAAALDAIVETVGPDSGSALIGMEVRHLGGALAAGAAVPSVLDRVAEPYAAFGVGFAGEPEARTATEASLAALSSALEPWRSARQLPTLADAPLDPEAAFGASAGRLREVEAAYDPDGRILLNRVR